MIRFALNCAAGHDFESWFANGAAFDGLSAAKQLSCPFCGNREISKALMVPALGQSGRKAPATAPEAPDHPAPAATAPAGQSPPPAAPAPAELEKALTALRRQIEANSEYVGLNFASEARRIHSGDAPERPIYGEAKPDEARQLVKDGIEVAPLPFVPRRKAN